MEKITYARMGHGQAICVDLITEKDITSNKQKYLQIDCGSLYESLPVRQSNNHDDVKNIFLAEFNKIYKNPKLDAKCFYILSHFHDDHFNMIQHLSIDVDQYAYPLMPSKIFSMTLLDFAIHEFLSNFRDPLKWRVFSKIYPKFRSNKEISIIPVVSGINVLYANRYVKFLWPSIDKLKELTDALEKKLKKPLDFNIKTFDLSCSLENEETDMDYFCLYIKLVNSNSQLAKIFQLFEEFWKMNFSDVWNFITKSSNNIENSTINASQTPKISISSDKIDRFDNQLVDLLKEIANNSNWIISINDKNDIDQEFFYEYLHEKLTDKTITRNLKKAIENIQDHISISLHLDDEYLFFGDNLEKDIELIINYYKAKEKIESPHFEFLNAPHHGTRWNICLKNINFKKVFLSNGIHPQMKFSSYYLVKYFYYTIGDCYNTYDWDTKKKVNLSQIANLEFTREWISNINVQKPIKKTKKLK